MGELRQFCWIRSFVTLCFGQQGEQADGHQTRVVKVGLVSALQQLGHAVWSARALVTQPLLNIVEGVTLNRLFAVVSQFVEGFGIKAIATA